MIVCLMQNFDTREAIALGVVLASDDSFVEQFVPPGAARMLYRHLRSEGCAKQDALLDVLKTVVALNS